MTAKRGPEMQQPSHKTVLQFVQENDCPFVTTQDVAEEFDNVTQRTVRERLHDLSQKGRLRNRRVGSASIVWYLPATK